MEGMDGKRMRTRGLLPEGYVNKKIKMSYLRAKEHYGALLFRSTQQVLSVLEVKVGNNPFDILIQFG